MKKLLVILILLLSVPFAVFAEEYNYSNSITVGDYSLYYPDIFTTIEDESDSSLYDRHVTVADSNFEIAISFNLNLDSYIARLSNAQYVQAMSSTFSKSVEESPFQTSYRFAYADECVAAIRTDLDAGYAANYMFIINGKDQLLIYVRTPDPVLGYQLCDGLLQHIDAKRFD